jgi:hypothetical protein
MPAARKYESAAQRQAAYRLRCKTRGGPPMSAATAGSAYHRWETMRKQALSILEQITGEMEVYFDQRSETWRDSARGEAFAEMMDSLADIVASAKEVPSHLPDA